MPFMPFRLYIDPDHINSSPPPVSVFFPLIVKSTLLPVAFHSTLPRRPYFHLPQRDTSGTDYTMQQSTVPPSSLSALPTYIEPSVRSMPRLEDEWSKRNTKDLPPLDVITTLVDHALELPLERQDPLTILPGSRSDRSCRSALEHQWQHCGTRIANQGGCEREVDLFAVSLATEESESPHGPTTGATLRVIFSRKKQVDGQSRPTERATMTIDDFPPYYKGKHLHELYPDSDRPKEPNAYGASIPPSMDTAIATKIKQEGDAGLDEYLAHSMVQGVDQMLKLHFGGSGEVYIQDPWPVPELGMSAYDAPTAPGSIELTPEQAREQAEMDQFTQDTLKKTKKPAADRLSPEEKAAFSQIGPEIAAWLSQRSNGGTTKTKRGKEKKGKSTAGPSAMSDDA
jgi:hypothetical protein